MFEWIIGCYAILILLIIGLAALVATVVSDPDQRRDAFRVLKLMTGVLTGTGGLITLLLKLHEWAVL